jgi:hypothetical protein
MSNIQTVNGLIRSNVMLSASEKKAFQTLARKRGVSYSTVVREAMTQFLGSKADAFEFRTSPNARPGLAAK